MYTKGAAHEPEPAVQHLISLPVFGMEVQPPQAALNWLATEKDDDLCSTQGCSTDHDPPRQDHPYAELDRSQLKEMGTSRVYVQFRLRYTIVELKSHCLPVNVGYVYNDHVIPISK